MSSCLPSDGEEISATVTMPAYRKAVGVETYHSYTTVGGFRTAFTFKRETDRLTLGTWRTNENFRSTFQLDQRLIHGNNRIFLVAVRIGPRYSVDKSIVF